MLISKCTNREEILLTASKELKEYGIKIRSEKQKLIDNKRQNKKFFKIRLEHQQCESVQLHNGVVAMVPKFVLMACERIEKESKTEGLFRRSGNVRKQQLIRDQLERGIETLMDKSHGVIDVANLLKTYFRELPVPLIPTGMIQDALIRCLIHCTTYEEKTDALLTTCLFLPPVTINTLAYFLQFLVTISKNSTENFMTIENLVKVLTPTIMPIPLNAPEKRLQSHFKILELLIENANLIGIVPDRMIKKLETPNNPPMTEERKKKKRRSGSLNRVFSGFRKIVGALGSSENLDKTNENTMDDSLFAITPNITKSSKKRRLEKLDASSVFSSKKKKDHQIMVLSALPEIDDSGNQSPYGSKAQKISRKSVGEPSVVKNSSPTTRRHSLAPGNTLRVNKRTIVNELNHAVSSDKKEEEYVKVSKSEYEAFKTRLNSIETKISHEFNAAKLDAVKAEMNTGNHISLNGLEFVESKFHETLKEVGKIEDAERNTDQLAKRLSRELKIRPHLENGVIRSPSARKIGSLRRRRDSSNTRLSRNQSWHLGPSALNPKLEEKSNEIQSENFVSSLNFYPKPNLKRARLVDEPFVMNQQENPLPPIPQSSEKNEKIIPEKPIRKSIQPINSILTENWTPATEFFQDPKNILKSIDDDQHNKQQNDTLFKTPNRPKKITVRNDVDLNNTPMLPPRLTPIKRTPMSEKKQPLNQSLLLTPSLNDSREARASIIQIRNQNAGMVAQKAKLFDNLSADLTKSVDRSMKIPRVIINKNVEIVKKMNVDSPLKNKSHHNVPLNMNNNSPRRSSRSAHSPGVNRRMHLRIATQSSPMLKTIKENNENIDRRINILKSDILSEISSPRKRDKKSNTPKQNKTTSLSSKKPRTPRHTPSKSPRIPRRHHKISFD